MKNMKSTKSALFASVISLLLCCSMLIGTTFAWFTDSVSSDNNIIQTGKLKVAMSWADGELDPEAGTTTWTDATTGPIFTHTNWEPGYADAKHIKVTNVGTLAFKYQMRIVANGVVSDLANVIDVYYFDSAEALERGDLTVTNYLGTLNDVLGTTDNLARTAYGELVAENDSKIHSLVFKMKEEAGNEYQGMDLGCTFSIQITATQLTAESDSFDNQYDAGATKPELPAAQVKPFDKRVIKYTLGINGEMKEGTLDVSYQFLPTQSWEEAKESDYRFYHADFVVYADHDVPADSIMLAGYYKEWCQYNQDAWVGLTAGETITAGTKVRLVSTMLNGYSVNWEELCKYGNDGVGFLCGASDLTGENSGTTITVELYLYAVPAQGGCDIGGGCTHPTTECETSEKILAGRFTYTFE